MTFASIWKHQLDINLKDLLNGICLLLGTERNHSLLFESSFGTICLFH